MRKRLALSATALLMTLGLAACHGSSPSSQSTPPKPSTPASAPASTPAPTQGAPTPKCTIPQGGGGDHDADNNGGPDDGDGCDV